MSEVLRDLAPQEIKHRGLRALYDYWAGRRAGDSLPGRQHIDPIDIPALLANLMLIDVAGTPPVMSYRLVGTAVVKQFGHDPTGLALPAGYPGADWEEIQADCLYVIETGRTCLRRSETVDARGKPLAYRLLLLPLAGDGVHVDMILAGLFWDGQA